MKTLFASVALLLILSACKKDRTCTCTDSSGNTVSQVTYPNSTKKDAQANCTSSSSGITCTVK